MRRFLTIAAILIATTASAQWRGPWPAPHVSPPPGGAGVSNLAGFANSDGTVLLDPRKLADAGTPGARTVQYVGEFDQILGRPDLGQPLTLRIREARGRFGSDAVLGRADASLLHEMPAVLEFLLGRGRIIIRLTL